jgi:integrase
MPRLSKYPIPKKRFHGGRWRIYWKWNLKQYSIATEHLDAKKVALVNNDLRIISAALAMDTPVFPDAYLDSDAVRCYLEDRFGHPGMDTLSMDDWLEAYTKDIQSACSAEWAYISLAYLRKLDAAVGGIENVAPDQLAEYLADIALKKSAGTRNRTHNAFSRFFNWAVTTKRIRVNPLAGIKRVSEQRTSDIVYCTPGEREEIIELARKTGWEEWLAVPVAFFSGMRREEIANVRWDEIRLQEGTVLVAKTKTNTSRTLPLSSRLEEYLLEVPEAERKGYVVPIQADFDRPARLNTLMLKIRKLKKERTLREWGLKLVPASKSAKYKKYKKEYAAQMKQKAEELENQLERIGWNPFRHTFGSLLAQAGVSLDKISSWMGNTPEVCRRHYAQFIPRDRRDGEIDKL